MKSETANIEISGTVVFIKGNIGSKSEAVLPYLYVNRSEVVKILVNGDNPFENNMLLPYDGKKITAAGCLKSNGMFIIESISENNNR